MRGNREKTKWLQVLLILFCVSGFYAVSAVAEEKEAKVSLNFKDADIRTLTSLVSEATGRNFVIDPRVKGKVTVISSKPMEREELYQVFLSILQVHGFAVVESGRVIKIIPDAEARTGNIPSEGEGTAAQGDLLITRIIPVEHISAEKLVPILRPLIPKQGHLAAYPQSKVLIVSDRSANVARLLKIVAEIDRPLSSRVEKISLKHAPAKEAAALLTRLQPAMPKGKVGTGAKVVADEWTNSLLISGEAEDRLRLRALISDIDFPRNAAASVTRVIRLKHAQASELATMLNSVAGNLKAGDDKKGKPSSSEVSIVADENIHALIITAPLALFSQLEEVVRQVDLPRAQVLVEALIAEVSTDKAEELGIQWRLTDDLNGQGFFGGTRFDTGTTAINSATTAPLTVTSGISIGMFDGTSTVLGTDYLNIGMLIQALSGDSASNILSTPTLVVRDNEEAEIVVGQNVPFLTGQYTNTGGGSTPDNPFQTIERKDIGLTLKVKPRITDGRVVRLDIAQEVSSVSTTTVAGASDLVTNKRSIKTSVSVHDGRFVALGGLIDDNLQETEQSVPVLGDIPVLGELFRSRRTTLVKRNLMVFIRPIILRSETESTGETSMRYNRMRDAQLEHSRKGVQLMPEASPPQMPNAFNAPEPQAQVMIMVEEAEEPKQESSAWDGLNPSH